MRFVIAAIAALSLLAVCVTAQDPAEGWMAYAVGQVPTGTQRITRMEMTWKVGANPPQGSAFFSPWFGADPADNLNLIQPVNPWVGSNWLMYTEYYQWSDGYNSNSINYNVNAGQTLHGKMVYLPSQDAYNISQTIVETGESSQQIVPCQNGKKFVIPYVVYEKVWDCGSYPPDQVVTFTNIVLECDGKDCVKNTKWTTSVVDSNCEMTAHVDKYPSSISITWNVNGVSKYANHTEAELREKNLRGQTWANAINF